MPKKTKIPTVPTCCHGTRGCGGSGEKHWCTVGGSIAAPPPSFVPKQFAAKRSSARKRNAPALVEVGDHLKTLGMHWKRTVEELMFQLPATDARGLPGNIHLLDTLRKALAIYQEVAAWGHVEAKLRGP